MEGREDIFAEMKEKFWPTFKVSQAISAYSLCTSTTIKRHVAHKLITRRSNIYSFSFGKSFFIFCITNNHHNKIELVLISV